MSIAIAAAGSTGCATLANLQPPARAVQATAVVEREIRPEAPPEYDVLVAHQHEVGGDVAEAQAAYERALAKDPDSAYIERRLADVLMRQGHPGEALAHAERAFELDPDDLRTRLFLGQLYRLRRDPEAAAAVLLESGNEPFSLETGKLLYQVYLESDQTQEAVYIARWLIAGDADAVEGYIALARALEASGAQEQAEEVLRDALETHPGNLRVLSQLARAARERGDPAGEQAIYREVLGNHPHHHATLLALADVQLGQSDIDGAVHTLTEIETNYPEDMRSIVRLGYLHYESENFAEAAPRFEAFIEQHPEDSEVRFFLGIVRRRLGDDPGAIEVLSEIPEADDHYAEARTQLAVLYERAGDFPRAVEEVERAVAVRATRPRELYAATLRAKAGDFDGAVQYLEALLLQNPDDDELLYNLGVVYGEAKRTEEAIAYMKQAIERNPQNASALNYVGYTWAERGDNLDLAEEYIVRALDLRPDDGFITDSLGWVYYMRARPLFDTGREEEARRYVERALQKLRRAQELTGGDPVVSEHLGDAYLLLQDKERALESYEEALDLVPREGEQPHLLDKLENLRREFE